MLRGSAGWCSRCARGCSAVILVVGLAACSSPPAPQQSAPQQAVQDGEGPGPVLPRVSDLGSGWYEVFSGSYSKVDLGVDDPWVEPSPHWFPDILSESDRDGGEHVLEFLDGSGEVLASVRFMADDEQFGDALRPLTSWRVGVLDPPDYTSYRIIQNGAGSDPATVYEHERSARAPVVWLDSPAGGDAAAGATVAVSWRATDADGEELSQSLYYSTDGGSTYRSVCCGGRVGADRYGESSAWTWSLDRALLEGSAQAKVLVVVSDGSRWATAASPVFSSEAPFVPEPTPTSVDVEFVAFGGGFGGDGGSGGGLSGVSVAIVELDNVVEWWAAVGGRDSQGGFRVFGVVPGDRMQSTAGQLAEAPANFVTTAADGTARAALDLEASQRYVFCAISPADSDVVAGCSAPDSNEAFTGKVHPLNNGTFEGSDHNTVYIFFSHGRAYVNRGRPNYSDLKAYSRHRHSLAASGAEAPRTATISVVATVSTLDPYANDDGELMWAHPLGGEPVAVILDADVATWWDTVSDRGKISLGGFPIESRAELIEQAPAHTVTTDHRGVAQLGVPAGDYLICVLSSHDTRPGADIRHCLYENITPSHSNVFHFALSPDGYGGLSALSDKTGRLLLQDAQQMRP